VEVTTYRQAPRGLLPMLKLSISELCHLIPSSNEFFPFVLVWSRTKSIVTKATTGPVVPAPDDDG
jgi:hypothetical protein